MVKIVFQCCYEDCDYTGEPEEISFSQLPLSRNKEKCVEVAIPVISIVCPKCKRYTNNVGGVVQPA